MAEIEKAGTKKEGRVKAVWTQLDAGRSSLLKRCEQYADWTLPYIMPKTSDTVEGTELPTAYGSIGARCVNHLANVITEVLFPVGHPFFRLRSGDKLKAAAERAGLDISTVDVALSSSERAALNRVSISELRAVHVEAVKHLIVTGNALLFYPDPADKDRERRAIMYSLRDYCVLRDRMGDITKLVTRDKCRFDALPYSIQQQAAKGNFKPEDKVELFTLVELDAATDKFMVTMAVNEIDINPDGLQVSYPRAGLPWIPITWTRNTNESYGRGLVEQYAYGFNAYNSLSQSLVQFAAIASDIKRCVDPGSNVDVEQMNSSKAGQWVPARKDELWASGLDGAALDMQAVQAVVIRLEQTLSQAFLLATAAVRDAERVTTEEIKLLARELEKSHGGIYSKLASEWQSKLASILLLDIGISDSKTVKVQIVTGADSLSRSAEMENLYTILQDIDVVSTIQAKVQGAGLSGWLNEAGLVTIIQANRGVEQGTVFLTAEQKQQKDAAAAEQAKNAALQEQAGKFAEQATTGV